MFLLWTYSSEWEFFVRDVRFNFVSTYYEFDDAVKNVARIRSVRYYFSQYGTAVQPTTVIRQILTTDCVWLIMDFGQRYISN